MLDFLTKYNYFPPQLKEYCNDNICVTKKQNTFFLEVDNQIWMAYDYNTHWQAVEFLPHYLLAKGHCICTGMGFGVRENWLMNKKEVTKITIIEKNKTVLDYHKHIQSPFLEHCEIIINDASQFNGTCDTLLLDHYENESYNDILTDVKKVSNNINHETLWFWPFEYIIMDRAKKQNNLLDIKQSYYQSYEELKTETELDKLPNFDKKTLNLICDLVLSRRLFLR